MTELDRSLFINSRDEDTAKPHWYDLWALLSLDFVLKSVNDNVYAFVTETWEWVVLKEDKRLTKYIETLEGIYDNLSENTFD